MTLVPKTHKYKNDARKTLAANDDLGLPAGGRTLIYSELLATMQPTINYHKNTEKRSTKHTKVSYPVSYLIHD